MVMRIKELFNSIHELNNVLAPRLCRRFCTNKLGEEV